MSNFKRQQIRASKTILIEAVFQPRTKFYNYYKLTRLDRLSHHFGAEVNLPTKVNEYGC